MRTSDARDLPYDLSDQNLLTAGTAGFDNRAMNATAGHSWVIGPTKVNSFRVFVNDINSNNAGGHAFEAKDLGIDAYTAVPGYMPVIVAGGFTVMNSFGTHNVIDTRNFGVSDDFTQIRGSHEFKFGGRYMWSKSDSEGHAFSSGRYNFTGAITGNAMADFVLGRLAPYTQGSPNEVKVKQPVFGAYAQDTWRLDTVTLNYGLVWNPYFSPVFYTGEAYLFSRERFLTGQTSQVMKGSPPGFIYPGDEGFNGNSGIKPHYGVWDPRISAAWDLSGDGTSSVRAGVSLGHDYPTHVTYINTSSVAPFRSTVVLPAGGSLDDPWATYPGGNPFPYVYDPANPKFPAYSAYVPLPSDLRPSTQYSWNVGYQRQVTRALFASASYVGTKINHVLGNVEQNPALNMGFGPCTLYDARTGGPVFYPVCTAPGNIDQRRDLNQVNPTAALGYITAYDDQSYQNYHGMLLNGRLSLSQMLNFDANYTLSKCEHVQPATNALGQPGSNRINQPFQNNGPRDIALNEGPCPSDRRHIFNLRAVFTSGEYDGFWGALGSNWTASPVIQARSGSPVNVLTGLDNALNGFQLQNGTSTQRPNLVPGVNPYGDSSGLIGYFNPDAFRQPAPGTLGDTPYNYLAGPGYWQWDQAFTRGFRMANGQRLDLRAEIINVTNHMNRGTPAATLNNLATFGRITTAANFPRVWQFAVKYNF
jgi:hypothetical protein